MVPEDNPAALRYINWTLVVLFICVELYFLIKAAGAKFGLLWKLMIASVWMLVASYIDEAFNPEGGSSTHSAMWGVISTIGYIYIFYTAWFGEVAQLAKNSNSPVVEKGVRILTWFVLVGWAIYSIEYLCVPSGWLNTGLGWESSNVDLILQYCRCDQQNWIWFSRL